MPGVYIMPRILLLSGADTGLQKLRVLLTELPEAEICALHGREDAEKEGGLSGYDLIVIYPPLSDCEGFELAESLLKKETAGVLVVVKKETPVQEYSKAEAGGAVILEKPFTKELFVALSKACLAARRRMELLGERAELLENRVEETKLVGRAKCVLIQYLNMTEVQAHRYIEKQAMDMRMSRTAVAMGILRAYES